MKKRVASVLVYLLVSLNASAAYTGNNLLQAFKENDPSSFNYSYALGYTNGASSSVQTACVPKGVTNGQVIMVVQRYLEQNPRILNFEASTLIFWAINDAWPCPSVTLSKPKPESQSNSTRSEPLMRSDKPKQE